FDLKAGYTLGLADIEILKRVARMALAAMESEPDCNERKLFCSTDTARMRKVVSASDGSGTTPLYHRAAMLQAGTLTNEDTKQAWTGIPDIDNAINMLDRIDTLESCDDDRIEAVKTVLRGLAGNSPVIPDSSADMLRRWLTFGRGMQNAGSQLPHNLIAETESMLAAAPQSPGSDPATVPGKWISVSERMPENDGAYLCWDNRYVTTYAFIFGAWQANQFIAKNITHWMPLPAGPQEVR
ncbi:DUF551 domain-containing protein, partial [Klebsiella pneumoniae]|uniref:DUF551 domain-containing protein n=1 Tax=Klebsiella pneumoniae TaxID=573 RepID=UPI002164BE2E